MCAPANSPSPTPTPPPYSLPPQGGPTVSHGARCSLSQYDGGGTEAVVHDPDRAIVAMEWDKIWACSRKVHVLY